MSNNFKNTENSNINKIRIHEENKCNDVNNLKEEFKIENDIQIKETPQELISKENKIEIQITQKELQYKNNNDIKQKYENNEFNLLQQKEKQKDQEEQQKDQQYQQQKDDCSLMLHIDIKNKNKITNENDEIYKIFDEVKYLNDEKEEDDEEFAKLRENDLQENKNNYLKELNNVLSCNIENSINNVNPFICNIENSASNIENSTNNIENSTNNIKPILKDCKREFSIEDILSIDPINQTITMDSVIMDPLNQSVNVDKQNNIPNNLFINLDENFEKNIQQIKPSIELLANITINPTLSNNEKDKIKSEINTEELKKYDKKQINNSITNILNFESLNNVSKKEGNKNSTNFEITNLQTKDKIFSEFDNIASINNKQINLELKDNIVDSINLNELCNNNKLQIIKFENISSNSSEKIITDQENIKNQFKINFGNMKIPGKPLKLINLEETQNINSLTSKTILENIDLSNENIDIKSPKLLINSNIDCLQNKTITNNFINENQIKTELYDLTKESDIEKQITEIETVPNISTECLTIKQPSKLIDLNVLTNNLTTKILSLENQLTEIETVPNTSKECLTIKQPSKLIDLNLLTNNLTTKTLSLENQLTEIETVPKVIEISNNPFKNDSILKENNSMENEKLVDNLDSCFKNKNDYNNKIIVDFKEIKKNVEFVSVSESSDCDIQSINSKKCAEEISDDINEFENFTNERNKIDEFKFDNEVSNKIEGFDNFTHERNKIDEFNFENEDSNKIEGFENFTNEKNKIDEFKCFDNEIEGFENFTNEKNKIDEFKCFDNEDSNKIEGFDNEIEGFIDEASNQVDCETKNEFGDDENIEYEIYYDESGNIIKDYQIIDNNLLLKYKEMEKQQEILNKSLISLTTHFAQVQLRLKQIINSPKNEQEILLKNLEKFTFIGIPEVNELCLYNNNKNNNYIQEKLEYEKEKHKEMINKLKKQLEYLENYVYEFSNNDSNNIPTNLIINKQKIIINELKEKLNLNISEDYNKQEIELRNEINENIIYPLKNKQHLIEQLKIQIYDLEKFINFLQTTQNCKCTTIKNNVQNDDIKYKTLNIMKKISTILHIFAEQHSKHFKNNKTVVKSNLKGNHYGDILAQFEISVQYVIDICNTPDIPIDSDYMSDNDESILNNNKLSLAIRKHLTPNLQKLLQHGLNINNNIQTVSVVQYISCSTNTKQIKPIQHIWDLIKNYYENKHGDEYNCKPNRKLSESFNLDLGSSTIGIKQSLLASIGNILNINNKYKKYNYDSYFKSFVCDGLNKKLLIQWLNIIINYAIQQNYYSSWSYVYLTNAVDMTKTLKKLYNFHFNLIIFDVSIRNLQSIKDAF